MAGKSIQGQSNDGRKQLPIPHLLRPEEVAEILGVHRSTVHRLAARGQLPCVRIPPRTLRFLPDQVSTFINRCRQRKPGGIKDEDL